MEVGWKQDQDCTLITALKGNLFLRIEVQCCPFEARLVITLIVVASEFLTWNFTKEL